MQPAPAGGAGEVGELALSRRGSLSLPERRRLMRDATPCGRSVGNPPLKHAVTEKWRERPGSNRRPLA